MAKESPADKLKREMAEAKEKQTITSADVGDLNKVVNTLTPEQIAQIKEEDRTEEQQKILDDAKAEKFAKAQEAERTRAAEKHAAEAAAQTEIENKLREAGKDAEKAALDDDTPEDAFETDEAPIPANNARAAAEAAVQKLRTITMSYPVTTPNEHTIFGANGIRITLGDLRDAFMMNRR